ncbi:MAG: hypothetical protein GEV06_19705 [Luteitalea sp.]|nr:hypothetical protein [Luteitalea sp.]
MAERQVGQIRSRAVRLGRARPRARPYSYHNSLLFAPVVSALLILASAAGAEAQTRIIPLAWGYVEITNNEVSIISTVDDPPKVRMASIAGGSLGALSFGRLRPDGVQEEMVLIQGKQDERARCNPRDLSGEVTVHIRNGNDPDSDRAMTKVFVLRHDGAWLFGQPEPVAWKQPGYCR